MINSSTNDSSSPNKALGLFTELASSSPFYAHYLNQIQQHQERLLAAARFHFQHQQETKALPHKRSPSSQPFHPGKPNSSAYYSMSSYHSTFNRFPTTSVDPSSAIRQNHEAFGKPHFSNHHNFQTSFPMQDQGQNQGSHSHLPQQQPRNSHPAPNLAMPSETFSQTLAQMSHNQQHYQQLHLHQTQLRQSSPSHSAGLFSRPYPSSGKDMSPYKNPLMSVSPFHRHSLDDRPMKDQRKSKSPQLSFKSPKYQPYPQLSRFIESPLKCEPIDEDAERGKSFPENSGTKDGRTSKERTTRNEKFESIHGTRLSKDLNDNHLLQAPVSSVTNDAHGDFKEANSIKRETSVTSVGQSSERSQHLPNYFTSNKMAEASRPKQLESESKAEIHSQNNEKLPPRSEIKYINYPQLLNDQTSIRSGEEFDDFSHKDGRPKNTTEELHMKEIKVDSQNERFDRPIERQSDLKSSSGESECIKNHVPSCSESHFVRGTLVHLSDGRSKRIEQLKTEDFMNCQIPFQANQLIRGSKSDRREQRIQTTKANKDLLMTAGKASSEDSKIVIKNPSRHDDDDDDDVAAADDDDDAADDEDSDDKTRDDDDPDDEDDVDGEMNGHHGEDDYEHGDDEDYLHDLYGRLVVDTSKVIYMKENHEAGTVVLGLAVGKQQIQVSIETSTDHPFFCLKQGWSSCDPSKTLTSYGLPCQPLTVGDVCIALVNDFTESSPAPSSPRGVQLNSELAIQNPSTNTSYCHSPFQSKGHSTDDFASNSDKKE